LGFMLAFSLRSFGSTIWSFAPIVITSE
jgi:hypothetical protein